MLKQVALTSCMAFEKVLGKCNPQEDKVLLDIYDNPVSCVREISERSKIEISSVTRCVNSLAKNHFIDSEGTRIGKLNRRVNTYRCNQKGSDYIYYGLQTRRLKRDRA